MRVTAGARVTDGERLIVGERATVDVRGGRRSTVLVRPGA